MNEETGQSTYRVAADELRAFIERFERLDAEKKDIADQQKEVMAEAKGRGYLYHHNSVVFQQNQLVA